MLRFKATNIYTVASVSVILLIPASFKLKMLYVDKVFFPFPFNMLTDKDSNMLRKKDTCSLIYFIPSAELPICFGASDKCSLIHACHLKRKRNS